MKLIGILVVLALIAGGIYIAGSDVDVTGGNMPEVNVDASADAGQMPEYEVKQTKEGKLPSVDVDVDGKSGTLPTVSVDTPNVSVETETRTIEVPVGIDVNAAKESMIDKAAKPESKEVK